MNENIKHYIAIYRQMKLARPDSKCQEIALAELDRIWYSMNEAEINELNKLIKDKVFMSDMNIFETVEEYKALRTFWKNYYAEGKHRPKPKFPMVDGNGKVVGHHMESDLNMFDHAIYLSATGKSLRKAFGSMNYITLYNTVTTLRSYMYWVEKDNQKAMESFFIRTPLKEAINPKYSGIIIQRLFHEFDTMLTEMKKSWGA